MGIFRKEKPQPPRPPAIPTWEESLLSDLRRSRAGQIEYIEHLQRQIAETRAGIPELDRRIATVEQLMKIRQVAATLKPLFKQAQDAVENL